MMRRSRTRRGGLRAIHTGVARANAQLTMARTGRRGSSPPDTTGLEAPRRIVARLPMEKPPPPCSRPAAPPAAKED